MTVGFVSKWLLIEAALTSGQWWAAALIVMSSLIAVIYVWRILELAYLRPAPEGAPEVGEAPLTMLIPMWTLVGLNFYFGIHAQLTTDVATRAAQSLLGVIP